MVSGEDDDDSKNDTDDSRPPSHDKLRRRNSGKGSAWTSSVHVPASDIPLNSKSRNSRQHSNGDPDIPDDGVPESPTLAANRSKRLVRETNMDDDEDEDEESESPASEKGEMAGEHDEATRMSLMSLLADTDEHQDTGGLSYMVEDDDEEEEEEVVLEESGCDGKCHNSCSMCMIKHNGAPFGLCGHTFCKLCSKEMLVDRGSCPVCNNYILEILDVF